MSPHTTSPNLGPSPSPPPLDSSPRRPLTAGVYVPTLCFFDPVSEDVDAAAVARHAVRLASAGVAGLATQGSNGEAVHLTHAERRLVTATTRRALDAAGFPRLPLIVGCGAQSVRETVLLCRDALDAGGDYALVLPPSYYASMYAPSVEAAVSAFFAAVAEQSPIPILVYNYPGAAGGIDLSSDAIVALAAHPNVVGVKLTCGNTGKLNRVAAATRSVAKKAVSGSNGTATAIATATNRRPPFLVLAGSADFALQSLVVGGHGMLAGLANIAPRACVRVVDLFLDGRLDEARAAQDVISRGDWAAIRGGVVGGKAALQGLLGYGGFCRAPLPRPDGEEARRWKDAFGEIWELEESLLDVCD